MCLNFPNLASTFLIWPEKRLGTRFPPFSDYALEADPCISCLLHSLYNYIVPPPGGDSEVALPKVAAGLLSELTPDGVLV